MTTLLFDPKQDLHAGPTLVWSLLIRKNYAIEGGDDTSYVVIRASSKDSLKRKEKVSSNIIINEGYVLTRNIDISVKEAKISDMRAGTFSVRGPVAGLAIISRTFVRCNNFLTQSTG